MTKLLYIVKDLSEPTTHQTITSTTNVKRAAAIAASLVKPVIETVRVLR